MLAEEPTQYLFTLRTFLFNERVKRRDPSIELLIEEIAKELSKRQKLMAGPIR
jgi:hypothetical protein